MKQFINKQNNKLRVVPKLEGEVVMKIKYICLIGLCSIIFTPSVHAASLDSEKIQQEADERSANSTIVESGSLYEYVSSLCSNAVITDYHDGTVSVDLTNSKVHTSYSDSFNFLWLACRILGSQKFLPDYKEISFSYMEGDVVATLNIYDYIGIDDFTSSLMCIGINDTSISSMIKLSYNDIFHNFDYKNKSNQAYGEIAEKYGINYDSGFDPKPNDYWWILSSYDPHILFSFEDNKAVINYKNNLSDSYNDGYNMFKEVRDSTGRYSIVTDIPGGLSFDSIDVVCFNQNSDDHLFDFSTTFQVDRTWKNTVTIFNGEEFKKGILAASEE